MRSGNVFFFGCIGLGTCFAEMELPHEQIVRS